MICICYNASRQKRYDYVPCEQRTSPGCTANTFEGSSLFISVVEHPPGYLLSLLCLSNHLQMRWQVTPAATVTKKDMTISICSPPPVAGYRLDNTVSISQNVCSINNICGFVECNGIYFSSEYKSIPHTENTRNNKPFLCWKYPRYLSHPLPGALLLCSCCCVICCVLLLQIIHKRFSSCISQ